MSASLAIIAALPREVASLVHGLRPDPGLLSAGIHLYLHPRAVIVAAGMGAGRVTLAVEAARNAAPITTLLSAGLAGSCTSSLLPGALTEPREVVNVHTGERTYPDQLGTTILATTESIASIQVKHWLRDTYPADLVDMEAATVGRLAAAHHLRFRVIKAISDAHDFELSDLNRFATPKGEFRTAAFALHTALRPSTWSKAVQLGRNSTLALKNLHVRLLEILAAEQVS